MGDKPLTLASTLAVFICLGLAVTFFGGFATQAVEDASDLIPWRISFFALLAALGLCIYWHKQKTRPQVDLAEDILAKLSPATSIFQIGSCHLLFMAIQENGFLKTTLIAQNRYDAEVELQLTFSIPKGEKAIQAAIPTLSYRVAGSAVIVARLEIPITYPAGELTVHIKPDGRCKAPANGNIVRFGRRSMLQSEVKPWMTAMGALGGGIYYGGARVWPVEITLKTSSVLEVTQQPDWQIEEIWRPNTPVTIDEIADSLGFSRDRRDDPVEPSLSRWLWLISAPFSSVCMTLAMAAPAQEKYIQSYEALIALFAAGGISLTCTAAFVVGLSNGRFASAVHRMTDGASRRLGGVMWVLSIVFWLAWFAINLF